MLVGRYVHRCDRPPPWSGPGEPSERPGSPPPHSWTGSGWPGWSSWWTWWCPCLLPVTSLPAGRRRSSETPSFGFPRLKTKRWATATLRWGFSRIKCSEDNLQTRWAAGASEREGVGLFDPCSFPRCSRTFMQQIWRPDLTSDQAAASARPLINTNAWLRARGGGVNLVPHQSQRIKRGAVAMTTAHTSRRQRASRGGWVGGRAPRYGSLAVISEDFMGVPPSSDAGKSLNPAIWGCSVAGVFLCPNLLLPVLLIVNVSSEQPGL